MDRAPAARAMAWGYLAPWIGLVALFLLLWLLIRFLLPPIYRGARGTARKTFHWLLKIRRIGSWSERHHKLLTWLRDYVPLAIILAIGGAIAIFAGDGFLDLAEELRANSQQMLQFDHSAHSWANSLRGTGATRFFVFFAIVGGPPGLAVLVGLATVLLAISRRWRWATYLLVTTAGGALLNLELKNHFARARPDLAEALRQASGYSFPSGHAMGSTFVLLALAYLGVRSVYRWIGRSAIVAAAISGIVAVSFSRIYLGVHWTTDVVAGISAGVVWVGATTLGYEALRRIRRIRKRRKTAMETAAGARA